MEQHVRVVAQVGRERPEPPQPDPGTAQPEQPTPPPKQPAQSQEMPGRDTPPEHVSKLPPNTTTRAGHGG
jgi:hypothetical protein